MHVLLSTIPVLLLLGSVQLARADAHESGGSGGGIVCTSRYALCSAAACEKSDSSDDVACECVITAGANIGNSSCEDREARLISTFSFANFPGGRVLTCPAGTEWAQCLDASCAEVSETLALCTCTLGSTDAQVQTVGGDCQAQACSILWSAATPAQLIDGAAALAAETGTNPVVYCTTCGDGM